MKYEWNWTDFFKQGIRPPFVIGIDSFEQCRSLPYLPFMQGLQVIVASVPRLNHAHWTTLRDALQVHTNQHRHIDYWLLVGQLIVEELDPVQRLLADSNIERATQRAQRWLSEREDVEQFAFMSCLYAHTQHSMQGRMMFDFLLEYCDREAPHMQSMLRFYHGLTERQKDVAFLAAQGLTNQEIADALCIEQAGVAEHLTAIFTKFQAVIQYTPDKHGTRYRLIHKLTSLLIAHPYLRLERLR